MSNAARRDVTTLVSVGGDHDETRVDSGRMHRSGVGHVAPLGGSVLGTGDVVWDSDGLTNPIPSQAVAGNELYLRGRCHLYSIGLP